jgi:hypothetical protein
VRERKGGNGAKRGVVLSLFYRKWGFNVFAIYLRVRELRAISSPPPKKKNPPLREVKSNAKTPVISVSGSVCVSADASWSVKGMLG